MIRILTSALAASLVLAFAGAAQAQESAPDNGSWSFSFGGATDNRSKDASKSMGDAFAWGEARWESASGFFYVAPAFETIKSSTGSNLEISVATGIRPELAGFDLDLSVEHKWQVDADQNTDDDSWEFTADVKRSIGPASGRLRLQHSPDSTGSTEAWTWVEAQIGWDFTEKLGGSVAVGRRDQDNSVDYTGWNAGLTYAVTRNIEAEVRYYDTDADPTNPQYADALVAGLSFSF